MGPGRRLSKAQYLAEEREREAIRTGAMAPPTGEVICWEHGKVMPLPGTKTCPQCQSDLDAQRMEYDPYAGHPDPDDW